MAESRLNYLFNRYAQHQPLSDVEERELMVLLTEDSNTEQVQELIAAVIRDTGEEAVFDAETADFIAETILATTPKDSAPVVPIKKITFGLSRFIKWVAAAVLVTGIGTGIYFWMGSEKEKPTTETGQLVAQIVPGGDKAILTLADGTRVVLDSARDGILRTGDGVVISKTKNGELVYTAAPSETTKDKAVKYHTISTPRGGKFNIELPDGSRVWLNAESSVRFPTSFSNTGRQVDITGEAYFEVVPLLAKNETGAGKKIPFKVTTRDIEVAVTGTSFNIMSYDNEAAVQTTLLTGSVEVSGKQSGVKHFLKPGQQAVFSRKNETIKLIESADTELAVAWKNDVFYMDEMQIPALMRQLSRWYDIEIAYPNGVPAGTISGKIPRNMSFANVLKVLDKSGVKLKLTKTVIEVYP